MTKEELTAKITDIMEEALKIDTVKSIVKDMDRTMNRDDLSDTARDALAIGYSEMLHKTYKKIRFIWLHLYELRIDVMTGSEPAEEEIAAAREVIGDD